MDLIELKTAFDGFQTEVTRIANEVKTVAKQQDSLDEFVAKLDARLKRPGVGGSGREDSEEVKAFRAYCRGGLELMDPGERKSLVTGVDPQGGYLAPAQFVKELERNLVEFSPIRAAARVGQTTSGSVQLPKRTAGVTGYWVGEVQARQETQPTYGLDEVPINEIAAFVDVSAWQLEDSAFDMEAELAFDFAEAFGALEGAAFVSGNGVKQPLGLLQVSGIPEVPSGSATSIADVDGQGDGLRTLLYNLPAFYRSRSSWLMNSSTLAAVAKLKDAEKNYIWSPGLTEGQPGLLLGRPVIEANDMPDVAAGSTPIILGDFSRYRIFDRTTVQILRDPFTRAANGMTRFHGRKRVGGQPQMVEAFRKLRVAVS